MNPRRPRKIMILAALVTGLVCSGCGVNAMPKEFAKVTQSVALSMLDQAIWDDLIGNIRGEVISPGVRVAAGVMYIAEAQITGASGTVSLSGEGHGTQAPAGPEVRAVLLELLGDEPELIDKILKALADSRPASDEE